MILPDRGIFLPGAKRRAQRKEADPMRAVITGATGFLGGNLAIELLERGVRVRCTRRKGSRTDHLASLPIEWVEATLSEPGRLEAAFRDADVVFHCAARVSLLRRPTAPIVAANVEGTRNVIEAFRRSGAGRLVHASSVVACALSEDGRPVTEAHPWNFDRFGLDDAYSRTKYEGERVVREAAAHGLDAVIVNPTYMLGPCDPKPSSGRLILGVVNGTVPGYTEGMNNFVDVRDVCRGMIAAWEKGKGGERYILGHENLSYREIMEKIARIAGVPPPRFGIPPLLSTFAGRFGDLFQAATGQEVGINSVTARYAHCRRYTFSSEKARRELGYRSGPIETAIHDAIAWFRKRGMLPRSGRGKVRSTDP